MMDMEDGNKLSRHVQSLQKYGSTDGHSLQTIYMGYRTNNVHDDSHVIWKSDSLGSLENIVESKLDQLSTFGSSTHLETEVNKLKGNISTLTEENMQWRVLNNQLYGVAFNQVVDK